MSLLPLELPDGDDGGWTISGTEATCTIAGRYLVTGRVHLNVTHTAVWRHIVGVYVNGVNPVPNSTSGIIVPASFTFNHLPVDVATVVNLVVGDKVSLDFIKIQVFLENNSWCF